MIEAVEQVLGIQFTDTITLGGAILIAMGTVFGFYRVALGVRMRATNEIQVKTIAALEAATQEKDAHLERQAQRLNELGAEKDAALQEAAACEAKAAGLQEQLDKVPAYAEFMEFGRSMMEHVDQSAAQRQEQFTSVVVNELKAHDTRMQRLGDASLKVLDEIATALREHRAPG